MSIEALILGKMIGVAEQRTAKTGRSYVQARMRAAAGAEDALFIRITAFSESACAALLALGDGEGLAVAGTLKVSVWTPQDGEARPNLDLVAAQVLTPYHLKRRRDAMQAQGDDPPARRAPAAGRPAAARGAALDDGTDDAWLQGGAR